AAVVERLSASSTSSPGSPVVSGTTADITRGPARRPLAAPCLTAAAGAAGCALRTAAGVGNPASFVGPPSYGSVRIRSESRVFPAAAGREARAAAGRASHQGPDLAGIDRIFTG